MKNKKILWITQAAMLIALVVLSQLLTKVLPGFAIPTPFGPISTNQLITGILVNLILILGTYAAGFSCAAAAAVVSPLLAMFMGGIPGGLPQMVPVIMLGNLTIVFIVWLCFRASNGLSKVPSFIVVLTGIVAGAVCKFLVLMTATQNIVIPVFHVTGKPAKMITAAMSVTQLITALIGGIIAMLMIPVVKSVIKVKR